MDSSEDFNDAEFICHLCSCFITGDLYFCLVCEDLYFCVDCYEDLVPLRSCHNNHHPLQLIKSEELDCDELDQNKEFTCPLCGLANLKMSQFKKHAEFHAEEQPNRVINCPICFPDNNCELFTTRYFYKHILEFHQDAELEEPIQSDIETDSDTYISFFPGRISPKVIKLAGITLVDPPIRNAIHLLNVLERYYMFNIGYTKKKVTDRKQAEALQKTEKSYKTLKRLFIRKINLDQTSQTASEEPLKDEACSCCKNKHSSSYTRRRRQKYKFQSRTSLKDYIKGQKELGTIEESDSTFELQETEAEEIEEVELDKSNSMKYELQETEEEEIKEAALDNSNFIEFEPQETEEEEIKEVSLDTPEENYSIDDSVSSNVSETDDEKLNLVPECSIKVVGDSEKKNEIVEEQDWSFEELSNLVFINSKFQKEMDDLNKQEFITGLDCLNPLPNKPVDLELKYKEEKEQSNEEQSTRTTNFENIKKDMNKTESPTATISKNDDKIKQCVHTAQLPKQSGDKESTNLKNMEDTKIRFVSSWAEEVEAESQQEAMKLSNVFHSSSAVETDCAIQNKCNKSLQTERVETSRVPTSKKLIETTQTNKIYTVSNKECQTDDIIIVDKATNDVLLMYKWLELINVELQGNLKVKNGKVDVDHLKRLKMEEEGHSEKEIKSMVENIKDRFKKMKEESKPSNDEPDKNDVKIVESSVTEEVQSNIESSSDYTKPEEEECTEQKLTIEPQDEACAVPRVRKSKYALSNEKNQPIIPQSFKNRIKSMILSNNWQKGKNKSTKSDESTQEDTDTPCTESTLKIDNSKLTPRTIVNSVLQNKNKRDESNEREADESVISNPEPKDTVDTKITTKFIFAKEFVPRTNMITSVSTSSSVGSASRNSSGAQTKNASKRNISSPNSGPASIILQPKTPKKSLGERANNERASNDKSATQIKDIPKYKTTTSTNSGKSNTTNTQQPSTPRQGLGKRTKSEILPRPQNRNSSSVASNNSSGTQIKVVSKETASTSPNSGHANITSIPQTKTPKKSLEPANSEISSTSLSRNSSSGAEIKNVPKETSSNTRPENTTSIPQPKNPKTGLGERAKTEILFRPRSLNTSPGRVVSSNLSKTQRKDVSYEKGTTRPYSGRPNTTIVQQPNKRTQIKDFYKENTTTRPSGRANIQQSTPKFSIQDRLKFENRKYLSNWNKIIEVSTKNSSSTENSSNEEDSNNETEIQDNSGSHIVDTVRTDERKEEQSDNSDNENTEVAEAQSEEYEDEIVEETKIEKVEDRKQTYKTKHRSRDEESQERTKHSRNTSPENKDNVRKNSKRSKDSIQEKKKEHQIPLPETDSEEEDESNAEEDNEPDSRRGRRYDFSNRFQRGGPRCTKYKYWKRDRNSRR